MPLALEKLDCQESLFAHFAAAGVAQQKLALSGYKQDGYAIFEAVQTIEAAMELSYHAIATLASDAPYAALRYSDYRLAKADRIPVCHQFVHGDFQCLHFDYGLPLLPGDNQPLYGVSILYMPPDSVASDVSTRILPLKKLDHSRWNFPALVAYAKSYGDGWRLPQPCNTGRISAFLRFLDAQVSGCRFADMIDVDSSAFIASLCGQGNAAYQLSQEHALLKEHAVSSNEEIHLRLLPGQLLLIDNVACVHGRIGQRRPQEIWQLLFGVPSSDEMLIEAIGGHIHPSSPLF